LGLNQREKKNWFSAARRLASEGRIKAAKLALTKVQDDSRRFLIYREISTAQLKAGDPNGARRTLMTARNEALKTKSPYGLQFTLSYVVYGMAEAGLYDTAKAEIKRFPEADRLDLYFAVAHSQGKKGDLEAAKKTFAEAIQVELRRNPRVDYNLSEIGVRQVRMGLVDEARETASMIQDPHSRERVESSIKQRRTGP
jgi:tetratricopeptide (TPR) repeat protein